MNETEKLTSPLAQQVPTTAQAPSEASAPAPTDEAKLPPSAPEQAPQELVWPEDISFSKEAQTDFAQLVQTLRLTPQQAQQLIDFETRFARQTVKENQAQQSQWARQTQAFFGPRWQQEISLAVRAADAFGGPQLRALLEETGLGNHPVIVRTFNEIGKRISEDVSSGGSPSVPADKTFTEALYGN